MYGLLRKLPTTHSFLATVFSKILLETNDPPESWSSSNVTLIYKSNDLSKPENFRMIALTSCVSKVFHQILSDRSVHYLTTNGYIRNDIQKAFINGINGCIEHNILLQEIICHAKENKKTVHITFFDLADAFGSVSHDLIRLSLNRFGLPGEVTSYIDNLYSRLTGSVNGPQWKSEEFRFAKGVFQGDPLSPIIFLCCFNPVLEYLNELNDNYGYDLNGQKVITTPYADDFNLITANKLQHQKIINVLQEHTSSMGLKLKPAKCRSLSIRSGKPTKIDYFIGNDRVKTVDEDPQKFLGSLISFSGKTEETFEFIKAKIETPINRINSTLVRNEYKLALYAKYLLPSVRFVLTVHDLRKCHLQKLDSLCVFFKILAPHTKAWC